MKCTLPTILFLLLTGFAILGTRLLAAQHSTVYKHNVTINNNGGTLK